jgi:uncharacterized protein (TIGR02284 family)
METTERTTTVLNDLVQINNDRITGYQRAIEELNSADTDLQALFNDLIQESIAYRSELSTAITAAGDTPDTGTTNSGKIYRIWMDVKAAFTGHDRKTVLENCEFGEDAAQKAYRMALEDNELPSDLRALVENQKLKLKASHDKIKALRDLQ